MCRGILFAMAFLWAGGAAAQNRSFNLEIENEARYVLLRGGALKTVEGVTIDLPDAAELEVLGIRGNQARLGIDGAEGAPSDIVVPLEELRRFELERIAEDVFELDGEYGILRKRSRGKGKGGGMTYCYRDVKKTLLSMGICRSYPSGSMAWQGYAILQRECGMVPASYAASLPAGAVCVSSGGRSCGSMPCGHIAVKTKAGAWFGAGTKPTPWLKGRAPMGCLVPRGGRRTFGFVLASSLATDSVRAPQGLADPAAAAGGNEESSEEEDGPWDAGEEGEPDDGDEDGPAGPGDSVVQKSAPIMRTFAGAHARCARGCGYISWGIWGDKAHRARKSCHNSGEAIDIHAIRCGGRTFGPATARFRQYVSCMRGSHKVIFGNGKHKEHAHIQLRGCRKVGG